MSRALLAAILLAVLPGCKQEFTAPDQPDLYKVPHRFDLGDDEALDLSAEEPGKDLSAVEKDLSVTVPPDLAENKDGG